MTGTIAGRRSNAGAAHARAAVASLVQRGYSSKAAAALTGNAAWLRDALRAGGLEPWFQPIVSLPDGRVVGFEALARLRCDDGAIVGPERFIDVAESSGLIVPLGLEILSSSAAALSRWRQEPALAGVYVSVNVSPVQLVDPSFADSVRAVLRANALPGSALVLEVTESGAAGFDAADTLHSVASTGVRLALDDFGTGFATLDSVKRLAVQILKLDRTFVSGVADGGLDTVIVRNVLELAYELDLSVVAEGVETEAQAVSLAAWGCGAAQGWLFGRPAPAEQVLATATRAIVTQPVSTASLRTGPVRRAPSATDDRLRTLVSLSRALNPSTTFRDLVGFLADEVREIVGAASVSISRWEREEDILRVIANVGDLGEDEERYPQGELYAMSEYPSMSNMLAAGMPTVSRVDDPDLDATERALLQRLGKGSGAAVPIYLEDRIWGELYATTAIDQPMFGARDVELLMSIAGVIGGALARGEHLDRIARLAFEDALTGLANRRAIDDRLADVIAYTEEIVTVVILDVNGLKEVNDEYGHAMGDRVLCGVADALTAATRGVGDVTTARLGGDEFCVVIVGGDARLATEVVGKAAAHLRAAPAPQVTIAAGVATSTTTERATRDLFAAADQAQYVAKRTGRLLLVADADGTGAAQDVTRSDRRSDRRTAVNAPVTNDMSAFEIACARVIGTLRLLPGTPVPDVLDAVAGIIAAACDANRWAVSRIDEDGSLHIARLQLRRTRPAVRPGSVQLPEDEVYALDDFPLSKAAVMTGRPFWVHVEREDHDDAERMVLRELGLTAVLGIGTSDDRSGWLLELYADEISEDPGVFMPLARLVSLTLNESAHR